MLSAVLLVVLILSEYRSFLRSREHYADIFASNLFSVNSLASALGKSKQSSAFSLSDFYAAHPPAFSRLKVAQNPIDVLVPHRGYFSFIGLLSGAIYSLVNYFTSVAQSAFGFLNLASGNYFQVMGGATRWHLAAFTALALTLVFPFAAALASMATRDCLGKLLFHKGFWLGAQQFAFNGAIFASFFLVGNLIKPFVSEVFRVGLAANGAWTLVGPFLKPNLVDFEFAGGIFISYWITNVAFASGLKRSLVGARTKRPGIIWQMLISLIWLYLYLLSFQMIAVSLDFIFDNSPAVPNSAQLLILVAFFMVMIFASWAVLSGVSLWFARTGRGPDCIRNKTDWAPWLYFSTQRQG